MENKISQTPQNLGNEAQFKFKNNVYFLGGSVNDNQMKEKINPLSFTKQETKKQLSLLI